MNKNVEWVKEQIQLSVFCNRHERQYLAEQIVERLGKPFGLDNATIRLLNALGELTPDVEINGAVTAMSVATVRIKRLEEELDVGDLDGQLTDDFYLKMANIGLESFELWHAASLNSIAMRWHEKQEDGWNKIEDTGLPEEGRWYDTYTWTREGHRTVQELFLDGEVDDAVYWLGEGDWQYPVTHWKERTDPPKEEEMI